MDKRSNIFVAGGRKMIGAAILRALIQQGYENIIAEGKAEPDLTTPEAVDDFFKRYKPEIVVIAAGKSGGIAANQNYPADFIRDNLQVN